MTNAFSRRRFLAGAGMLGAAGALGAFPSLAATSGASMTLLPGAAPTRWAEVLAAVNAKMQAEIGCTLDAQYFPWSNFGQQSLLKFTTGEKFDTGLQGLWLNLAQLVKDGAVADLTDKIGSYPNLNAAVAKELFEVNAWSGRIWGIPQVNTAARLYHHVYRQDLAEKYGMTIANFGDFERYLYTVKEKESGMIPFCAANGTAWILAIPRPTSMFDATSWESPNTIPLSYGGKGFWFFPAKDAATTGSASLVPFWEVPQVIETFKRIRKYYNDGIINADAITVDNATIQSQFVAGKYASTWAVTDGGSSARLPALRKNIPTAALANVAPFADRSKVKPNQTFQADNIVVINANGGDIDRALQIQDWLSIRENNDLLSLGVEGTDWKAVGDNSFEPISTYAFPGYALTWRTPLWRRPSYMSASEAEIFSWSQDMANFTVDPFASFRADQSEVSAEVNAMFNVMTEFGNPLYYGVVDVDQQIEQLKRAADGAGLDKLLSTLETQANAHLANR